jgi:hypothetical protein
MRAAGDIFVPEGDDAVSGGGGLRPRMSFRRVLQGLPGAFVSGQVLLIFFVFGGAVRVRGGVV